MLNFGKKTNKHIKQIYNCPYFLHLSLSGTKWPIDGGSLHIKHTLNEIIVALAKSKGKNLVPCNFHFVNSPWLQFLYDHSFFIKMKKRRTYNEKDAVRNERKKLGKRRIIVFLYWALIDVWTSCQPFPSYSVEIERTEQEDRDERGKTWRLGFKQSCEMLIAL